MTSETVKKVAIPARAVDYRGKVVLAPMVRSGELPSRLLALHYGADLVWGPETVDHALIGTTRRVNPGTNMIEWTRMPSSHAMRLNKVADADADADADAAPGRESVIYRLDPVREAGRLIFQLGTSDPERAVAAARLVAADVAGIDVNAGCPKPFSTTGGMGAALLRTPDRLAAILEALVAAVGGGSEFALGVSVKIRLLETAAETEALVRRLVATGIAGLTVHCRTTPMRKRQRAIRGQLRMVAGVCREAGVACLMNGDVESRDEAARLVAEYGVDGAMIATAAEADPSCFRAVADGGRAPWHELVDRYLRLAMEVENKFGNTKFTLAHLIPGKEAVHRDVARCKSYVQICQTLAFLSDELLQKARIVDERLGISPEAKAAAAAASDKNKKRKRVADDGDNERKVAPNGRNTVPAAPFLETAPVAADTRPPAAVAVSM